MIEILTKIGIPKNYAGDIWLLSLFLVAGFILIALVKKNNLGALLVSVYVAYALVTKAFFGFLDNENYKLALFLVLLLAVFQIFQRFFRMGIGGSKVAMWAKVVVVSLCIVGLLSSVVMSWLSQDTVRDFFSPSFSKVFLSEQAQFFWMAAPLILVFFLIQRKY